ncbi:ComF family protein [Candidatus Saccharibacteria bacterium]|nr:ComF family protein [Candidatus Saccharibacteria bacterium]MBQ6313413.1 ComF family protein [Candidatus Saccharibacteria bacterium]
MQNIVKITTFLNPLNLLAPHSCRGCGSLGKPLCDCCKNYILNSRENYCPNCKAKNETGNCKNCKNLPKTFVVAERSSLIGKLIYDFKFSSVRALSDPLAELLDKTIPEEIPGNVKIVPLPTISKHIRARGLDHTYLIAKKLSKLRNYKTEKLLLRARNTIQVGASEITRKKQAEAAYKLAKNVKIDKDATYILFDDIWTTGASMKAAVKKLRQAGVSKIIIATLAVNRLD